MLLADSSQKQDVSAQEVTELRSSVAALQQELSEAQLTIQKLRNAYQRALEKLRLMEHRLFVAKAERTDVAVEQLAFEGMLEQVKTLEQTLDELSKVEPKTQKLDPALEQKPEPKKPSRTGRRNLAEANLPIVKVELPDPVLEGKAERIGVDESWYLGWQRGGLRKVVVLRPVYKLTPSAVEPPRPAEHAQAPAVAEQTLPASDLPTSPGVESQTSLIEPQSRHNATDEAEQPEPAAVCFVKAAAPKELIGRGMLTADLIAHILVSKYLQGVPFYRLEQLFELQGYSLDRATLCRYAEDVGATLGAIVEVARKEAFDNAFCLSTDATGVCIQPGFIKDREIKQRSPCHKGHFFVILADQDHVFFEYQPKHTSAAVSEMFKGFSGYIQADAHTVYDTIFGGAASTLPLFAEPPAPKEVGCWSHARRNFWQAATCKYSLGVDGLKLINNIFATDRLLAKHPPRKRHALRLVLVKPLIDSFFVWAHEQLSLPRERGLVASALGYVRNQEAALRRFLEDGRLKLDNNGSERALKIIAAGRKAWLFFGSNDHASAAANLFSLIASCKLHRLDPEAYLAHVIRVMPYWPRERYLELSPKYWPQTLARLIPQELVRPIGHITVPPPMPKQ